MKTLELFNCVQKKGKNEFDVDFKNGVIIPDGAAWAKQQIVSYLKAKKLSGEELNKSFYKSWSKILNSTREELLIDQIMHYLSTYGTNFEDEIYIPEQVLEVPEKLKFVVIKALSQEEINQKCLDILSSGVALKQETVQMVLDVLDENDYQWTGEENIRNKEAVVILAETKGLFPKNPSEFLRFIVYRATGNTLLIKDRETIDAIQSSTFNPSQMFKQYGLVRIAEIFNRYKPLFMAFKHKCPKTINKISKLSKKHHKPLVENPLNNILNYDLTTGKYDHWLDNATNFALLKALSYMYSSFARIEMQLNTKIYKVRNGKSWVQQCDLKEGFLKGNVGYILSFLDKRINIKGEKFYIPSNVRYTVPTSEKMFVGNIPFGTKIISEKLAVGVYWRNDWGARDIDLSSMSISGKVGWNSSYNQHGDIIYSGDITNAPNGAVEYLYVRGEPQTSVVVSNVYYGENDCDYKIVVGEGDNVNYDYMMNPNKVLVEEKCQSIQKQTILGLIDSEDCGKVSFTFLNVGAGSAKVSGYGKNIDEYRKGMIEELKTQLRLDVLLQGLGAEIVDTPEEADVSLSLKDLDKTTFIKLLG